MRKIDVNQIKRIHILINKLKLDDVVYRALLQGQYNVNSSKDLDFQQAQEFIMLLETKAVSAGVWKSNFNRRQKYNELGNRPGYASPAQLRMIESMWHDVSFLDGEAERKKALNRLIFKITGANCIEDLFFEDVKKIVRALKSMKQTKKALGGV